MVALAQPAMTATGSNSPATTISTMLRIGRTRRTVGRHCSPGSGPNGDRAGNRRSRAGSGVGAHGPDHLTFDLTGASKLSLSFYGKRPGPGMKLDKLSLQFALAL